MGTTKSVVPTSPGNFLKYKSACLPHQSYTESETLEGGVLEFCLSPPGSLKVLGPEKDNIKIAVAWIKKAVVAEDQIWRHSREIRVYIGKMSL